MPVSVFAVCVAARTFESEGSRVGAFVVTIALSVFLGQAIAKPTIAPYFSDSGSPSFWIECRNSSATGVPRGASEWMQAYRIDGTAPPRSVASVLGDPTPVQPGDTWRGILDLRQQETSPSVGIGSIDTSGAYTRRLSLHPLAPGRHTIAVQCFDTWSDDLAFVWEPERSGLSFPR